MGRVSGHGQGNRDRSVSGLCVGETDNQKRLPNWNWELQELREVKSMIEENLRGCSITMHLQGGSCGSC